MYVKEMHIEVRQSTQKIGANRTRKLLDPEIDWLLNKHQDRFIRDRIRPKIEQNGMKTGGFEILQDDVDSIRILIRRGVVLPAFLNDARTVRCPLPGDYAYLTQDESVIKRIPPIAITPPTITSQVRYLLSIPISTSQLTTGPYYKNVTLTINGNTVFDIGQYTNARNVIPVYQGLSSKDQVFVLWPYILRSALDAGYNAYWEYYQDTAFPRSLIILSSTAFTGSIAIDGVTAPGLQSSTNVQVTDLPATEAEYQANRLTASNIVSSLLEVAFYGTQPEFPISELGDRSLYVYPNKNFIVTNTVISYVRKPRRISLILGTDCELPEEYHQLICDLTEEYFKGMIADPNWEVKLQDNMRRTIP